MSVSSAGKPTALRSFSLYCATHVTPAEAVLAQRLSDLRSHPWVFTLFVVVSRLGDGPLWYTLVVAGLLAGTPRTRCATLSAGLAVGLAVALFMRIKARVGRPRPFEIWADLPCLVTPPDRFSFPSGHTMTAFAVVAVYLPFSPGIACVLLPLAILIGVSRVFLGLHYPSDVLVGALLGSAVGTGVARGLTACLQ